MFLIPYWKRSLPNSEFEQIWLFLERGGTHLFRLEAVDPAAALVEARVFLEGNDIAVNRLDVDGEGGSVFAEINAAKTDLAMFYSWGEVPLGTPSVKEMWRPFLWHRGSADNASDMNIWLEEITLGESPKITAGECVLWIQCAGGSGGSAAATATASA